MHRSNRIADFDDPSFDPFATFESATQSGSGEDPYARLAEMRRQKSVFELDYRELLGSPPDLTMQGLPKYMVLGAADIQQVLETPQLFSNTIFERNVGLCFGRSLTVMDAPEHTRYRRLFQKAFMPSVVSKWGDTLVDPVVHGLIEGFKGKGRADLVREFTQYYPFQIIYRQLELPQADIAVFHKLAVGLTCIVVDVAHGVEASQKLGAYYALLLDERRNGGGSDLVSTLAQAEIEGERLPDEVLVSFLRQLINAAGDTTYRATSSLLAGLLSNPDQLDAVRRDRALIPAAIEEALRWEPPVTVCPRLTLQPVVLDDVQIPAGAEIDAMTGAYNRDPARYDKPDRFDIGRKPLRHMGFAYGAHVCIGQHLARVEMTRALNALFDHLPNLRLDPDYEPPQVTGVNMRVPAAVHVRFDA
ncbi:MAG: cytochrome [Hydrocarboniphaga sp.]|uniref:cytochrome P450 n=1 Tax=Hydrocarboniphaga sp. TaxID=2033016 RepID=UPI0026044458|nr:cytochrome P450 [Hydrocarboniphaga sp.]MDB5971420.1 cytochrome [Hydrocarboniphaga sp.]